MAVRSWAVDTQHRRAEAVDSQPVLAGSQWVEDTPQVGPKVQARWERWALDSEPRARR